MAGKPGRPKKVVQVETQVVKKDGVDFFGPSTDQVKVGQVSHGTSESYFDRDLFQASAVIAGAMAAGQGGWAPVISKTAVKVAKELLEIVKEG